MEGGGGEVGASALEMAGVKRSRGSTAKERISKMPPCVAGKRTSMYRGVTRHRWTGRYEAHMWDKSTCNLNHNKKGKQVYLGAYDEEEAAARAYDLAALKYWGPGTLINFPVSDYARDIDEMQNVSREEYLASLRRKSSAFSRGMSKFRRLARASSQNFRWEARFSHLIGSTKYLSMGNHYAGEDRTTTYDMSQGDDTSFSMVTNVDLSAYIKWWQPNKLHPIQTPRHAEESQSMSEQRSANMEEPETPEWPGKPSEPYQLPSLGVSHCKPHNPSSTSALNVLLKSSLFKQMLEKVSAKKGVSNQSNIDSYGLEKVGLKQGNENLISQEEFKFECHELGRSSRPLQPSVQKSIAGVQILSTPTQASNTMHFHLDDNEGT